MRSSSLFLFIVSSFLSSWMGQAVEVSTVERSLLDKDQKQYVEARQEELRRMLNRELLTADTSAACYGSATASFTTSSSFDYYTILYPACTAGATYSCTFDCSNSGLSQIGCLSQSSTSDSIDINDIGFEINASGGCGSGITLNYQATVTGQLWVVVYCATTTLGGCEGASVTCTEDCTTATSRWEAAYDRVTTIVRNGLFRRGRTSREPGPAREESVSESSEDDRRNLIGSTATADGRHSKYIRGSNNNKNE